MNNAKPNRGGGLTVCVAVISLVLAVIGPAAIAEAADDGTDITSIGSLRVTSITDDQGRKYNGLQPDGSMVDDGVNASYNMVKLIIGMHGHLNDIGTLKEGDKVVVNGSSTSDSHFTFNNIANFASGPTVLTDGNGDTLFTIAYGNGSLLTLTRTSIPAGGSYDFDLTTAPFPTYSQNSLADTTTSDITIGNTRFTFQNDTITDDQKRSDPCRSSVNFNSWLSRSQPGSIQITNFLTSCRDINELLAGSRPDVSPDSSVSVLHLAVAQGSISGVSLWGNDAQWSKMADDVTLGNSSIFKLDTGLSKTLVKSTAQVHTMDEAATLLNIGEYAVTATSDGGVDIAVNMGPRQGDDAIFSKRITDSKYGDNLIKAVDKTIEAKLGPQYIQWQLTISLDDNTKPFNGVATMTGRAGGQTTVKQYAISNALGTSSGRAQSKVTLDANDGSGVTTDLYGDPDSTRALPANPFTRDGYTFTGWNTNTDGSGTPLTDKGNITFGKEGAAQIWYAQWKQNPITIACAPSTGDPAASVWQAASLLAGALSVGLGVMIIRMRRRLTV